MSPKRKSSKNTKLTIRRVIDAAESGNSKFTGWVSDNNLKRNYCKQAVNSLYELFRLQDCTDFDLILTDNLECFYCGHHGYVEDVTEQMRTLAKRASNNLIQEWEYFLKEPTRT